MFPRFEERVGRLLQGVHPVAVAPVLPAGVSRLMEQVVSAPSVGATETYAEGVVDFVRVETASVAADGNLRYAVAVGRGFLLDER